jgi:hypothetical protein
VKALPERRRPVTESQQKRPIHRSAWKGSSTKSVCRVWDTRHPKGQGRRRSGFVAFRVDRHMLWRCIEMRLAAWRGRRVGPRGYPAPSRYRYLPGPSCASCAHAPVGPRPPRSFRPLRGVLRRFWRPVDPPSIRCHDGVRAAGARCSCGRGRVFTYPRKYKRPRGKVPGQGARWNPRAMDHLDRCDRVGSSELPGGEVPRLSPAHG